MSLLQIMKKSFSTERIDRIIADVKFNEIFPDEAFWNVFNWHWNFLFESGNKDIINVEIFDLIHFLKLIS